MKQARIAQYFRFGLACRSALLGAALLLTALPALAHVPGQILDWGDRVQIPPAPSTHYKAIAAGDYEDIVLKDDGTIIVWAVLGSGSSAILTNTAPGVSNVTAIAASQDVDMALLNNGTVLAWGGDDLGMTNVPAGLSNVMAIAEGPYHCLALQSNANIVSWGNDYFDDNYNIILPPNNNLIKAVASGLAHGLALLKDGTVLAWGLNTAYLAPAGQAIVPTNLANVIAIAAGDNHSLALKADGTVVAWGWDAYQQCDVPPGLTNVVAISAGATHSVALKANGTVVAWGDNSYTQCYTPANLTNAIAISAEYYHTIALTGTLSPPASIPPSLQERLTGNHFIVTWPSAATGFSLQTTTNAAKNNSWTSVGITPVVVNSQNTVTNTLTNGNHFYRLFQ